jgi:predicted SAM-dependent methyltransferase
MKLHIGCGAKLFDGFINIDGDSKEQIANRYKMNNEDREKLFCGPQVYNWDIFNLPVEANSIDEIIAHGFIEHLSFIEERRFWYEVKRILKSGGQIEIEAPDFDELVKMWLNAEDNFKDFWKDDEKEHWFGQGNRNMDTKWGYLVTTFFGNQSAQFQYHKTAYTIGKMKKICEIINFEPVFIGSSGRWKGYLDPMIKLIAKKR